MSAFDFFSVVTDPRVPPGVVILHNTAQEPRTLDAWPELTAAREAGDIERAAHIRFTDGGALAATEERAWWARNNHTIQEPSMPDSSVNPKERQAAADGKAPLDYLDPAANEQIAWVLKHGGDKYGRRNFRAPGQEMKVTVYLGAILRHVAAIQRGEWLDPDDGRPHMAHIGACTHVTLGAEEAGTLVDDTQDCTVTALSDRVHVEGDTQAKGECPIAGLERIVDSAGTLHGISPDAYTKWSDASPVVVSMGGGVLTRNDLLRYPHGTRFIGYHVEPFEIDARCCCAVGDAPEHGPEVGPPCVSCPAGPAFLHAHDPQDDATGQFCTSGCAKPCAAARRGGDC